MLFVCVLHKGMGHSFDHMTAGPGLVTGGVHAFGFGYIEQIGLATFAAGFILAVGTRYRGAR